MSGYRFEAGRLFQILRPATEKLLSPSRVFVRRNLLSNVVNGHVSTIKLVNCWPRSYVDDLAKYHLYRSAQHGLWPAKNS